MSAPRTRAEGDEELSAKKGSETEGAGHPRHSKKSKSSERTARKGDLGRALRSVYDDTLREAVPDDFLSLIGKLT
ncbi:MAG: NepR family anti-sigma factor [Bryobacteraceae bacterium]